MMKNTKQIQNSIRTGFSESSSPTLPETIKKVGIQILIDMVWITPEYLYFIIKGGAVE